MKQSDDPEQTGHRAELLQTVRAHVASISAQTGLREPAVELFPVHKARKPKVNAQFSMPSGAPKIKVTEQAVRKLSHAALRFLLTHEFGHFATWRSRQRGWRPYFTLYLVAMLIAVTGFVLLIASISMGDTPLGPPMLAVGGLLAGFCLITLLARCRVNEYQADGYAAQQTGDLIGAREFFAALEQDAPSSRGRHATLWIRTHPVTDDRRAAVQATLAQNTPGRSTS